MKRAKFLKPIVDVDEATYIDPFELLLDPIRSKIVFEVLIYKEVTADMMIESTGKSRSTISHHLKRLVLGGLLDVFVGAGKTKYYRVGKNLGKLQFKTDKHELVKSPIEERSAFIVDMSQVSATMNQVFANVFSDTVKFLQNSQPFEKVELNDEEKIEYTIKGKKGLVPDTLNTFIPLEAVPLVKQKMNELAKELNDKFGPYPNSILEDDSDPVYILNFQLFPYFKDK